MKALLKISFPGLLIFAGIIAILMGSCTRGSVMCACYSISPRVRNHFDFGKSISYEEARIKCDTVQLVRRYDSCEVLKIK